MAICGVPIFIGPLFLFLGLMALTFGAIAWDLAVPTAFMRAFASIVDTTPALPGAPRRWAWRIHGPLNGTVFVLVGAYTAWGTAQCRPLNLGIPALNGPLAWTPWIGQYPFMLFALGIAIYNARQMGVLATRIMYVLCTLGFSFAAGQAAGFHVGVHASQWGAISFAMLLLSGVAWFLDTRIRSANDPARTGP